MSGFMGAKLSSVAVYEVELYLRGLFAGTVKSFNFVGMKFPGLMTLDMLDMFVDT